MEQAASVKHYLMKEPLSGDELLHYRVTRRKKELVDFDASESSMTAYFCARYENQKGQHGGRWCRRLFRNEKSTGDNGGE